MRAPAPSPALRISRVAVTGGCTAVCILALHTLLSMAQGAPDDPVRRARRPVRGQYMVLVHSSADPEAVAVETVAIYGGRLRHVYRHSIQGFAVQMSDGAARMLARDPRVALVEEDGVVTAAALQSDPPSWGLDRIDQRTLPLDGRYFYVAPETAVNVYVIDSGIRTTHVEFEGRAFLAGDFVDDDGDGDPGDVANDDADFSTPDGTDCHGHGTHVAGTIGGASVGVAKTAILWGLRVLGCGGSGTWSSVVAAVEKVAAEVARPAVVNMSISGAPSATADEAIRRSIASGITYVVAAGNVSDDARNYSPSRVAAALVVAASTVDDHATFFSNWGPAVDLFAPGEEITSASIDSDTVLALLTGTSVATAHVTGVVALYLGASPSALPAAAHEAIVNAATVGLIHDAGPGSPNRLLYSAVAIIPLPPILTLASLVSHVEQLNLNFGATNSLVVILGVVERSLARGNAVAALNQLDAFMNRIRALERNGQLDSATAALLATEAETIKSAI